MCASTIQTLCIGKKKLILEDDGELHYKPTVKKGIEAKSSFLLV